MYRYIGLYMSIYIYEYMYMVSGSGPLTDEIYMYQLMLTSNTCTDRYSLYLVHGHPLRHITHTSQHGSKHPLTPSLSYQHI